MRTISKNGGKIQPLALSEEARSSPRNLSAAGRVENFGLEHQNDTTRDIASRESGKGKRAAGSPTKGKAPTAPCMSDQRKFIDVATGLAAERMPKTKRKRAFEEVFPPVDTSPLSPEEKRALTICPTALRRVIRIKGHS
jgi:hypothetical protein